MIPNLFISLHAHAHTCSHTYTQIIHKDTQIGTYNTGMPTHMHITVHQHTAKNSTHTQTYTHH